MRTKLVLVVLMLMACSMWIEGAGVPQQETLVEDLEIRGNLRVSREEILKLIKTTPGKPFNQTQVMKDLEALMATGEFASSSRVVTNAGVRNGIVVAFHLKELPKRQQ